MRQIEVQEKYRVETESEAKEAMDKIRNDSISQGFLIKKMGYEHKDKKSKGEIIDSCEILTVIKVFGQIWD